MAVDLEAGLGAAAGRHPHRERGRRVLLSDRDLPHHLGRAVAALMVLQALVLALGFSSALAAGPRGQTLFIAGDGFTLDQAIADAQKERTPQDSPRYRILATGEEVRRLMGVGAAPDGHDLLVRA